MALSFRGILWRHTRDLCRVQPPDAENRTSGGVEGARGEIPVFPSDLYFALIDFQKCTTKVITTLSR